MEQDSNSSKAESPLEAVRSTKKENQEFQAESRHPRKADSESVQERVGVTAPPDLSSIADSKRANLLVEN